MVLVRIGERQVRGVADCLTKLILKLKLGRGIAWSLSVGNIGGYDLLVSGSEVEYFGQELDAGVER
jgi:hypothetical protein